MKKTENKKLTKKEKKEKRYEKKVVQKKERCCYKTSVPPLSLLPFLRPMVHTH
jgi:hypothetical protein